MEKEKKKCIYDGVKMSVRAADTIIAIELLTFVIVTAIAIFIQ